MRYQTEPTSMWFDGRIVLRKSLIHGTGTFVTEAIRAGETLIRVTGGVVYTPEDRQAGAVQLDGDLYNEEVIAQGVLIATPKSFHYYINHSCDPNAVDQGGHPARTEYVALRDIEAGEEVTADYYDPTTLDACACNSPHCRWNDQP